MKQAVHRFTLVCALSLMVLSAGAQPGPQRGDPVGRSTTPSRNQAPAVKSPFPVGVPLGNAQLPVPTVSVQPRPFNLDTALGRLFADFKAIAVGAEFELSLTNGGRAEVTTLPMSLHVVDWRVRTELDISSVPMRIESTGPFAAFRQVGITRLTHLTLPAVRLTYLLFPEAKGFITQPLAAEDMSVLVKLERKLVGKETLNNVACDKSLVTLVYPNGERRETQVWHSPTAGPHPVQIRFVFNDSTVTVRVRSVHNLVEQRTPEALKQQSALFELPQDFTQFADVGQMLQTVSARRAQRAR